MATLYIIDKTAGVESTGTPSITLQPGALNGPGSANRDSDLRLYGMGALLWGEGVNENFLRILENFACPAKALGDYNPDSGLNDFDPSTDLILPKSENDLGPGNGISTPVDGMIWFNLDNKQLYVFDSELTAGSPAVIVGGWISTTNVIASTIPPEQPNPGDTWFNLDDSTTASGESELWVYNPDHPEANAEGWVSVLEDYIAKTGGNVGGTLNMSTDGGVTKNFITNVETPINDFDAANKIYVDTEINLIGGSFTTHTADDAVHLTSNQNQFLDAIETNCASNPTDALNRAADICALSGYSQGVGSIFVDVDGKVDRAGDAMVGFLEVPHPPTLNAHAATKQYVDDELAVIGNIGNADRVIRYFSSQAAAGILDGDIHTAGGVISIYANGAWQQVFPAVYT